MKACDGKACSLTGTGQFRSHADNSEQNGNYRNDPKFLDRYAWANSADQDQTAPKEYT